MYQVRTKKTNTSESPFTCRNRNLLTSKPDRSVDQGLARRLPTYCPSGVRHKGDVSLVLAQLRNCRNLSARWLREKHKQRSCECESTDASNRDGASRSSVEFSVMLKEQRGSLIRLDCCVNQFRLGGTR